MESVSRAEFPFQSYIRVYGAEMGSKKRQLCITRMYLHTEIHYVVLYGERSQLSPGFHHARPIIVVIFLTSRQPERKVHRVPGKAWVDQTGAQTGSVVEVCFSCRVSLSSVSVSSYLYTALGLPCYRQLTRHNRSCVKERGNKNA